MAGRNYDRLDIEAFGRHLITSGDLDPVYIALHRLDWKPEQVHRWLIAYWCFYHCGFASYASEYEGVQFWDAMRRAAVNETPSPLGGRWPRGSERRHARGMQGFKMVDDLEKQYGGNPSAMIRYIAGCPMQQCEDCQDDTGCHGQKFTDVANRAKTHTLFGPWMAFKVADMMDRVLGVPVDFQQAHVFMFKDPVKAAVMLYKIKNSIPLAHNITIKEDVVIPGVVSYLEEEFKDLLAPPLDDRPVGLQEVETVLCKWKSHMNGHYPLNNDIDEINEGLAGWGGAADEFVAKMPEAVR